MVGEGKDKELSTKNRLSRLETLVGTEPTENEANLTVKIQAMEDDVAVLKANVDALVHDLVDSRTTMGIMRDEVLILRKAVAGNAVSTSHEGGVTKWRVPEPKPFVGDRNCKKLENFLWDMEQYFTAAHILENERVAITSMYLSDNAKLWCRSRAADSTRPAIGSWGVLKAELPEQFLPSNGVWVTRDALQNLKQNGTVRDYVKDFSALMLEISDMSEKDRLFNFIAVLQPWAQLELRRLSVKDLLSAMAAADGLLHYKMNSVTEPKDGKKGKRVGGKFSGEQNESATDDDCQSTKSGHNGKERVKEKGKSKAFACFICGGPHFAKECPKKERLGALQIGNETGYEEESVRVGSIQVLP